MSANAAMWVLFGCVWVEFFIVLGLGGLTGQEPVEWFRNSSLLTRFLFSVIGVFTGVALAVAGTKATPDETAPTWNEYSAPLGAVLWGCGIVCFVCWHFLSSLGGGGPIIYSDNFENGAVGSPASFCEIKPSVTGRFAAPDEVRSFSCVVSEDAAKSGNKSLNIRSRIVYIPLNHVNCDTRIRFTVNIAQLERDPEEKSGGYIEIGIDPAKSWGKSWGGGG